MTYFQYHNLIILFSPSITSVVFLTNFCDGLKYESHVFYSLPSPQNCNSNLNLSPSHKSTKRVFFIYVCMCVLSLCGNINPGYTISFSCPSICHCSTPSNTTLTHTSVLLVLPLYIIDV